MKTKWRIEKCKCGDPACDRYYIPGIVEGQGILTKEHAELIVRSVNSHEGLVELLKKSKFELSEVLKDSGGCDHSVNFCVCPWIKLIDQIDQALAAAGVK